MSINVNFSFLLAFFLPGFFTIFSLKYVSNFSKTVLNQLLANNNLIAQAVLIIIMSLTAGLVVSAIRSLALDNIHYLLGVTKREMNYKNLRKEELEVFNGIIDNIYRFSQFYGNMLIATAIFFVARYLLSNISFSNDLTIGIATIAISIILFFESRNSLKKLNDAIKEFQQKNGEQK